MAFPVVGLPVQRILGPGRGIAGQGGGHTAGSRGTRLPHHFLPALGRPELLLELDARGVGSACLRAFVVAFPTGGSADGQVTTARTASDTTAIRTRVRGVIRREP